MAFSYSRSRTAFSLSTVFLLLLSIITVSLHSSILAFISHPTVNQSDLINFDRQSFPVLAVLPQNLNRASSKLALASGAVSLAVSSACVIFTILFWPDGNRIYLVSPITSLTYTLHLNALLSFITMVYLQVAHLQSSAFDPNYRSTYGLYDRGTFDLESWACQVSSYKNDFPRGQWRNAIAGRVAAIFCCIAAIAAAAVGAWALRAEGDAIQRARNEKRNRTEFWLGDSDIGNDVGIDRVGRR